MISKKTFSRLKRGDVVLYNDTPRLVLEGPADRPKRKTRCTAMYVTFAILHRSWTGRAYTVQDYHCVKHLLKVPRKRLSWRKLCAVEKQRLADIGFDWEKEMRREVSREVAFYKETQRDCGDALRGYVAYLKRRDKGRALLRKHEERNG